MAVPWEIAMSPPLDLVAGYYDDRRRLYIDIFEAMEVEKTGRNRFASFMRSPAAEIVNLVNENYGAYGKRFPETFAVRLARLVFGEGTSWEMIKEMYKRLAN